MADLESFFEELKVQRESQNIEISEICEFTKIQEKYIIAIEAGDFNMLPNVYTRLFLKAYANFIGADYKKALNDYELYTTGKVIKKDTSLENNIKSPSDKDEPKTKILAEGQISYKKIASGIFVIIIIIIFLWWTSKITNENANKIEAKSINEVNSASTDNDIEINIDSNSTLIPASKINSLKNLLPLNENDFTANKKNSEITKRIRLEPPYKISIETINDTKINISKTTNSKANNLINRIVKSGEKFEFEFNSIINFDFLSSKDVLVKLNEYSLDELMKIKNLAIRGSYEASNSQLYLSFYNY
ncbi:MAG: helix-turn-helix transcriptional regulator [Candidatus Neomarinimicrobiota bacterium]|nr:helix-turn-helix transcriptional regulator [Candidatus Neomarinimicrobiota bacterium]